jgi:hypothetical protein
MLEQQLFSHEELRSELTSGGEDKAVLPHHAHDDGHVSGLDYLPHQSWY